MSPRKFRDGGDHKQQLKSGMVMNGPRPTPLKVKQESHTIHKQQTMIKKPIIIYTYSPEVIHTKPHDFMALVQKLTGHSGSSNSKHEEKQQQKTLKKDNDSKYSNDDSAGDQKDKIVIKDKSPMFNDLSSPYNVADIPLFTSNSSDYLCSSTRPLFRFSDMSPNMSNLLSPGSLVELLKGLPEY